MKNACIRERERGIDYEKFDTIICSTYHYKQQGNNSSRFSCNSEADASELQENLEEMFP